MDRLHTFDEALKKVLRHSERFSTSWEACSLLETQNRVLAEEILADADLPACCTSAMDGYCACHDDIASASKKKPLTLPIAGKVMAGSPLKSIPPKSVFYIATGGMLPENADVVMKKEDVVENERSITLTSAPPRGCYIRPGGTDMKKGEVVLRKGENVFSAQMGLLATLGKMLVKVAKKPTVGVYPSGNEVVMPFDQPLPWEVRNSNGYCLLGQVREAGGIGIDLGIARDDDIDGLAEKLVHYASGCDVLVTSGGISMGQKDPFIAAFEKLAVKKIVHGVAIKPGKPFFFGILNDTPIFGLPGNQASTVVTFELFVRPFLKRMLGADKPDREILSLPIATDLENLTGRDHFLRGSLKCEDGKPTVVPFPKQASHLLSSVRGARVLIRHHARDKKLKSDSIVECRLIGDI